jgi:hypothetical protein
MHIAAALFIRDPVAFGGGIFPGEFAVEGLCPFEDDPGQAGPGVLEEGGVEGLGFLAADAGEDLDARLTELFAPPPEIS